MWAACHTPRRTCAVANRDAWLDAGTVGFWGFWGPSRRGPRPVLLGVPAAGGD